MAVSPSRRPGLRSNRRWVSKPVVLKTVRGGYVGKGHVTIDPETGTTAASAKLAESADEPVGILEAFLDYALEASLIVARAADGEIRSYAPVENRHENHVLTRTIAPAELSRLVAWQACDVAQAVAHALDLVRHRARAGRHPRRRGAGQRIRPAPAQHLPLDARCLPRLAVRTVHTRHRRLAAGQRRAPLGRGDGQPAGRRRRPLAWPRPRPLMPASTSTAKLTLARGRKMGHVTWLKRLSSFDTTALYVRVRRGPDPRACPCKGFTLCSRPGLIVTIRGAHTESPALALLAIQVHCFPWVNFLNWSVNWAGR